MKTRRNKSKKKVFTRKHYNSNEGMLTSVWGPSLWHFLHTMSFNYPVSPTAAEKRHYKAFVLGLQHALPCRYCRENLKKNLKKIPLKKSDLQSREAFSKWMYSLHELVNKMLNKSSGLTYCQIKERYEHFRSRCLPKSGEEVRAIVKKETGCVEPLYGKKSKCVIKIVPQETKVKTFEIDRRCLKRRITRKRKSRRRR